MGTERAAGGRASAFLLAAALACFLLSVLLALSPRGTRLKAAEAGQAYVPPAPRGRLIVILLDSLQYRDIFGPDMPFLSSLRAKGAWGVSEVVSAPLSVAGTHAIFSGHIAGPLSILEDFNPARSQHDNLFRRAAAAGRRGLAVGRLLDMLYGRDTGAPVYRYGGLLFSQYRELGEHVFGQARELMGAGGWDIAAVSYYGLDHVGHLETPRSAAYREMLRRTDDWVRGLASLARPGDTLLVTSEHGIDDSGFHTGRNVSTLEVGFVITGPLIKKGGPLRLTQPDWAPTLSLLAGVPPFYDSPGVPALELLALPEKEAAALDAAIAARYGGSGPERLRLWQQGELRRGRSFSSAAAAAALMVLAVALLAAGGLPGAACAAGVSAAALLGALAISAAGLPAAVAARWPFSANFIMARPLAAAAWLAAAALLAALLRRLASGRSWAGPAAFAAVTAVCASAFGGGDPFHMIAWCSLAAPFAAWGATGRPAWLAVAAAFSAGLLIRRLTYYDAIAPLAVPGRWAFCAALIALGAGWARFSLGAGGRSAARAALAMLPAAAVAALPVGVEVRALLLLACLALLPVASRCCAGGTAVWAAVWAGCFMLGTSSSLSLLTHAVTPALLLALWSASAGSPAWQKGAAAGLGFWLLYLLPGNDFSLSLYSLRDSFVLGTATGSRILFTVGVVAARFVAPTAVLLWGLLREPEDREALKLAAAMLLPAFCAAALLLLEGVFSADAGSSWRHTTNLLVLSGYSVLAALSFAAVMLARKLAGAR